MSSHRMPLRVMLLITVHVVSTVVMVGFAWAVTPPSTMPDPIGFSWVRAVFSYIMVCQIYLVVFWTCLGQSAWVWRLVFGLLVLVSLEAAFVGFATDDPSRFFASLRPGVFALKSTLKYAGARPAVAAL